MHDLFLEPPRTTPSTPRTPWSQRPWVRTVRHWGTRVVIDLGVLVLLTLLLTIGLAIRQVSRLTQQMDNLSQQIAPLTTQMPQVITVINTMCGHSPELCAAPPAAKPAGKD